MKEKKTLRSSQESSLGPLNSGQMLIQHIQSGCCYYPVHWWQHKVLRYSSCRVSQALERSSLRIELCLWINAIYPLLQCQSSSSSLVRASDQNSEDPGLNPGWISMSSFVIKTTFHDYLNCQSR